MATHEGLPNPGDPYPGWVEAAVFPSGSPYIPGNTYYVAICLGCLRTEIDMIRSYHCPHCGAFVAVAGGVDRQEVMDRIHKVKTNKGGERFKLRNHMKRLWNHIPIMPKRRTLNN